MEEKVAQSMIRDKKHQLDKEITVKHIVDEEKKILQERYQSDINRL